LLITEKYSYIIDKAYKKAEYAMMQRQLIIKTYSMESKEIFMGASFLV